MLLDQDDALPDDVDPSSSAPPKDEPARVVVIHRSRGVSLWLIPPLLILVAVASVVAARRLQPPRPVLVYLPQPESVPVVAVEPKPEPAAAPVPPPVVVASAPIPAPVPVPVEPPREIPASVFVPEPFSDAGFLPDPATPPADAPKPAPVRDVVGFDPEALRAAAEDRKLDEPPADNPPPAEARADPAPPDRPFALDGINRDAKRIADERRRMAARRRPVTIPAGVVESKLKQEHVVLARREAEARRRPFLEDLRRTLREGGADLAARIDALADQSGRETAPELLDAAFLELRGPAARLTTQGKVQRLRLWGVPEPIILDHLIDTESGDVGGRHGPRDQGQAIVRAARILLTIPVPDKPRAASAAAPSS